MNAISLFSGMGGDSLGMKQAGINVIAYSEKVKTFRATHDKNFPNCETIGESVNSEITNIPDEELSKYNGEVDIIFAGFPCQGFSNAGKKKSNDPRNTLFKEFVRATRLIQPKYIIGENVKGLLSRKTDTKENYIDVIVNEFVQLGYTVDYRVFKTEKHGVPQKRERLIIIGIRNDIQKPVAFPPEIKGTPNLKNIIKFSMEGAIKIDQEYYDFLENIPQECIITDMNNDEGENNPHPYLAMKVKNETEDYNGKHYDCVFSFAKRDSPIHCEIIDIRKPSKTIICTYDHQPRLFVPLRNKNGFYLRAMLPDELKQIQGFPADYIVCGSKKEKIVQIGNAVPPPLIKQIVETMIQ
jgi:DNA (cytosine-5)-methyltransferase 1